jgi:hypothetical protein
VKHLVRVVSAWRRIGAVGAFLVLAGCPGGPDLIDPSADYPVLGEAKASRDSRTGLLLYTATFVDPNLVDDTGTMIRHTGYTIYSERGERLEYVRNYVGLYDTEPTQIELEPGRYLILLDNPEKQPPIFKVVIAPGKITTVKLPR